MSNIRGRARISPPSYSILILITGREQGACWASGLLEGIHSTPRRIGPSSLPDDMDGYRLRLGLGEERPCGSSRLQLGSLATWAVLSGRSYHVGGIRDGKRHRMELLESPSEKPHHGLLTFWNKTTAEIYASFLRNRSWEETRPRSRQSTGPWGTK